MHDESQVAFARFGLGRRHGEPVPADPAAWLRAQLAVPDPTPVDSKPSSADALARVAALRQSRDAADTDAPRQIFRAFVQAEIADFLGNALVTPGPFRERLVWFWLNHFTIAARTQPSAATAGAYVREAIRPNVTGRFADMLCAVMRHPAMLSYLDQADSIGPDSPAGEARHRGLNENLARECLELHTVTPAAGYTQNDVTAFARILTGWNLAVNAIPPGFRFRPRAHEPGEQFVMGRTWPAGEAGGEAILRWLADHPATHHNLAEKLVRHFVADEPPPHAVAIIETILRDSGGDLMAVSLALIDLPGAWVPLAKLRAPQDYVIASLRAVGAEPQQVPHLAGLIAGLGQKPFGAPFPVGWPDRAADWAGAEAMMQRVDFAYGIAGRAGPIDPGEIAAEQLGDAAPAALKDMIMHAGSRQEGLTLLLASPVFQRR